MTPERLAAIKEHFKNPPSASCNRDWALEVIAELETFIEGSPRFLAGSARALIQAHGGSPPPLTFVGRSLAEDAIERAVREALETGMGNIVAAPFDLPAVVDAPVVIDDRPKSTVAKFAEELSDATTELMREDKARGEPKKKGKR